MSIEENKEYAYPFTVTVRVKQSTLDRILEKYSDMAIPAAADERSGWVVTEDEAEDFEAGSYSEFGDFLGMFTESLFEEVFGGGGESGLSKKGLDVIGDVGKKVYDKTPGHWFYLSPLNFKEPLYQEERVSDFYNERRKEIRDALDLDKGTRDYSEAARRWLSGETATEDD